MKIYYAHSKAIYHSLQEKRDIDTLHSLGFEIINPSSKEIEEVMKTLQTGDERMGYFERFKYECDGIAFRALPDGTIPSGVAKEIEWFKEVSKPIIELPGLAQRKYLSKKETVEYLYEIGQR